MQKFRYLALPSSPHTQDISDYELRICAAQFRQIVGPEEAFAAFAHGFNSDSAVTLDREPHVIKSLCAIKSQSATIFRWLIGAGGLPIPLDRCYMTFSTAAKLGISDGADAEVIFLKSFDDISGMPDLDNLTNLDLSGCAALSNLDILSGLLGLKNLVLKDCSALRDITGLSPLSQLESLDMGGCPEMDDIGPIARLTKLRSLNLKECMNEVDLYPLCGLGHLEELCLDDRLPYNSEWVRNRTRVEPALDLSPIASLHRLKSLSVANRITLTDLAPLASLTDLLHLNLLRCRSLEDLSPLASFSKLKSLNLYKCQSLTDLSPLAFLTELGSLDLQSCEKVADLSPLSGCSSLKKLDCTGLTRVVSLKPLRELHQLSELEANFYPAVIAEILAHTAWKRADKNKITCTASTWLEEANAGEAENYSGLQAFVVTLASALSLLGESAFGDSLQALLERHPEFTSKPWKAWFGGTLKESGFDLYRQRVERVPVGPMLASAIGGACATLPIDKHSEWSRRWLTHLEKERLADAKSLLSVAPEICLAYARAGEREALGRWLERFTDPSDPGALDPVHVALGKLKLGNGEFDAAQAYIFAVQSPASRDPLLVDLVSALAPSNQDRASMALLLIGEPSVRSQAAKLLAIHPPLSETTIHRLVVSTGDSPQALADLIAVIPAASHSELLRKISQGLQPERKAILRAVATELHDYADRLLAEADNAD